MSEQNVECYRRLVEAYNARDIEAFIAYCDADIEFHALLAGAVGGAVYHGYDGLRTWHRDLETHGERKYASSPRQSVGRTRSAT